MHTVGFRGLCRYVWPEAQVNTAVSIPSTELDAKVDAKVDVTVTQ